VKNAPTILFRRGQRDPSDRQRETRNSWGIWIKIPAPSPVLFFAPAGAAMVQIVEGSQAITDNTMRPPSFEIDDEAHAAAIVFVARVVTTPGQAVGRYSSLIVLG